MEKITLANRLSIRIMAIVMVMTVIIVTIVYVITRDSMAREAETRYESVLQNENEKIRGVLSDVYVAAINNVNVIERDIDDPDKLQAHLERMVALVAEYRLSAESMCLRHSANWAKTRNCRALACQSVKQ